MYLVSGDFSNDKKGLVSQDDLNVGSFVDINGWSCFAGLVCAVRVLTRLIVQYALADQRDCLQSEDR